MAVTSLKGPSNRGAIELNAAGLLYWLASDGQSNSGHSRRPLTFSGFSGTNFCCQFFSTQARSCSEVAYWLGDSFSPCDNALKVRWH